MGARVATQERQAAVQPSVSIRQVPWYDISRLVTILHIAKGAEDPAPCLLMSLCSLAFFLGQARELDAARINGLLLFTLDCAA